MWIHFDLKNARIYFGKCTAKMCNVDCRSVLWFLWMVFQFWELVYFWKWTTVDKVIWKNTLVLENDIMLVIVPMKLKNNLCALPFYSVWDAKLYHAKCTLTLLWNILNSKKLHFGFTFCSSRQERQEGFWE